MLSLYEKTVELQGLYKTIIEADREITLLSAKAFFCPPLTEDELLILNWFVYVRESAYKRLNDIVLN